MGIKRLFSLRGFASTNTMRTFIAALSLQNSFVDASRSCQMTIPGRGTVTIQHGGYESDCEIKKLMECQDGTLVVAGDASSWCPKDCTYKGQTVKSGDFYKDCDIRFMMHCFDGKIKKSGDELGMEWGCPARDCTYKGSTLYDLDVDNDCDANTKFQCQDGTMVDLGAATQCGPTAECSYKGKMVPHGTVDYNCDDNKTVECVNGDMVYHGPAKGCSAKVFKECSYKGKMVPHGTVDYNCDDNKTVECDNGSMEYRGPAKGCVFKECSYKGKMIPHGTTDNNCDDSKKVECVDGSMEYRGEASGCDEPSEPPKVPEITLTPDQQVQKTVDDFEDLANTHIPDDSPLYRNGVMPVVKVAERMRIAVNKFACGDKVQPQQSRRRRNADPCGDIRKLVQEVIAWNRDVLSKCNEGTGRGSFSSKTAKLAFQYNKKLVAAEGKLRDRCENQIKRNKKNNS